MHPVGNYSVPSATEMAAILGIGYFSALLTQPVASRVCERIERLAESLAGRRNEDRHADDVEYWRAGTVVVLRNRHSNVHGGRRSSPSASFPCVVSRRIGHVRAGPN